MKNNINIDEYVVSYKNCHDKKKKRMLHLCIVQYAMEYVKKIACSISVQTGVLQEDLIQVGCIGLIKAIEFFNPDRNTKFKTYSSHFIKGEIKHYLRDKVSIIKTPRELHELVCKISNAFEFLKRKGILEPSDEQIAEIVGISSQKVREVIKADLFKTTLSLDQAITGTDEEDISLIDKIPSGDYQEFLNSCENKIMLADAIKELPLNLQHIIKMTYYEGLNQREIGEKMNISQMQVSRRLKKALNMMYEIITKNQER